MLWVICVSGIESADKRAMKGSGFVFGPIAGVLGNLIMLYGMVVSISIGEMTTWWVSLSACGITCTQWPLSDSERTGLGKRTIGILIGNLWQYALARMAECWDHHSYDFCSGYVEKEEPICYSNGGVVGSWMIRTVY